MEKHMEGDYLKWVSGFANAQGGKIYIGCDDNGNVIGLSNSKKLLVDIPNKIKDTMGIVAQWICFKKKIKNSDIAIKFPALEESIVSYISEATKNKKINTLESNLDVESLQILKLISESSKYTISSLADKNAISKSSIQRRINLMSEKGILERIGSTRNGYWVIKNK